MAVAEMASNVKLALNGRDEAFANDVPEVITLHVWENEGGVSWKWDPYPGVHIPFFIFGAFGGGWYFAPKISDKMRAKAELAIVRVREKFPKIKEARLVYGPPPKEATHEEDHGIETEGDRGIDS